MTDVEQAAREEARRRYSVPRENTYAVQCAFEAGAAWQRERPVTDAEVEAAVRAFFAEELEADAALMPHGTACMKRALEAARKARGGR